MKKLKLTALFLFTFAMAFPLTSSAVPITNLFNTGLDGGGSYLTAGSPDAHYSVISSPLGAFVPVATNDTAFPFPPWVPNNSPFSRWISPQTNSGGPPGNYLYRTTFSLPANATNVMIAGVWGTDDPGNDILINGISTGQTSAAFTSLVPFSVTSGFNVGLNTLDFLLTNAGGPTGLRVDRIRGKYDLVPEPISWLLAACGMGGLFMRRRV